MADESVTARFKAAALARNLDALEALLDPDVVLRSPVTSAFEFSGRDEVRGLLAHALANIENLEYRVDLSGEGVAVLGWSGLFAGRATEEMMLFRLGDDELIREITIFVRPLAATANFAATLAPPLAREQGLRARAVLARALTAPLAALLRSGDRLAPWLAGRRRPE
jgi:hypothetical protein